MSILKVACLQLKLNKTNNIEHIIHSIDKAYKDNPRLDLIVLSELAVGGAGVKDTEHTLDKYEDIFSKIAKDKSIWLIPGSFYEKVDGKIYNTAPVFNPDGKLITKAKKIYPWLPYEENVNSGSEVCIFNIPNKGKIGIHICYDLWFPETSRELALNGAELIINPTLTPTKDREIETIMVRSTSAQQQSYYIDINSCGEQGCGMSIATDPHGEILHLSQFEEDIFIINVDFNFANRTRKEGFMNLGQNLKSYRDNPFVSSGVNKEYLKSLGELKKFNKD
ncbi:MAG: carbon-nitrogen hydrolase family protein [Proteobacteria bacterium]|nr:carbon-nitrogen hydrolase family protein [Pseudomonadota bacterium]MDA1037746.1 carbon-nitrogen hydrolase family protein [Pseudomonadota bacterium]|tara:strand:- start:31 stop:867 length:837 start_codon:yes stop_codon:yes gene_type:complete